METKNLSGDPSITTSGAPLLSHNVNYARQAVPQATDSISYDFWWPYPDLGDSATTTITNPLSTSTFTSPVVAVTSNEANIDGPSNGPTATTASLIYITAFPPATTSPQRVSPKLPYHSHLNVIYLAPLFALLGVVLGVLAVTAWFKWRDNRRTMRRSVILEAGPPYVPPGSDAEGYLAVHETQSMEHVSLFAAATPSKFTVHGSRYMPKRSGLWPSLGRPQYSAVPHTTKIIPSHDGERFTVVQEDPFLVTPGRATSQSGISTSRVSLPKIAVSPSLSLRGTTEHLGQLASATDGSPHEELDNQEAAHRTVLDRLKFGSVHQSASFGRGGYVAVDIVEDPCETTPTRRSNSSRKRNVSSLSHGKSDGVVKDLQSREGQFQVPPHERYVGLALAPNQLGTEIDANGVVPTTRDSAFFHEGPQISRDDETLTKHPTVPSLVPEVQGSPSRRQNVVKDASARVCGDGKTYSAAPDRCRSKGKDFRVLSRDSPSTRRRAQRIHSSVLPRSPPLLMSPPLESTLFFTSPLSSSVSLGRVAIHAAAAVSPKLRTFESSPELSLFPLPTKRAKTKKKLRTSRSPPPLPYPSYANNRATAKTPDRSTSAGTRVSAMKQRSPGPKSRPTSVISPETAHGVWSLGSFSPTALAIALASSESFEALSKVNEIVARGYNEKREMKGDA